MSLRHIRFFSGKIQLFSTYPFSDDLSETLDHWRNALAECDVAWLESDKAAQEGRLKSQ